MTWLARWRTPTSALVSALVGVALSGAAASRPAQAYFGPPADGDGAPVTSPTFVDQLILAVARWQREFHQSLAEAMQAAGDGDRLWPVLTVAGFAFLYGVFHAIGPGHGKAVVAGYFVGQRAVLWRAVALGSAIAAVQGVSAIVLVGGLVGVVGLAGTRLLAGIPVLEMVSYALIIILGLHMLYQALRGQDCCSDDHVHVHHDHCGHDGAPRSDDRHRAAAADGDDVSWALSIWPAALAVGVRPCTGALIVLLFAAANQAYPLGAGAVAAMAVGVAITISVIGIGAIVLHRALDSPVTGRFGVAVWLRPALKLTGATIIILVGILMLLAALARADLIV